MKYHIFKFGYSNPRFSELSNLCIYVIDDLFSQFVFAYFTSIFSYGKQKHPKSVSFPNLFNFFSTWSVITSLFFMWFNIDNSGHKRNPKSENIAVEPEELPLPRVVQKLNLLKIIKSFKANIIRELDIMFYRQAKML